MDQRVSRRRRPGLTIVDVARHAGVSPMTVSRVLNGENNVRASTRELVKQAIQELGYSPNPAARNLASARSVRIGLIYSNPSAAYLSEFLVGSLEQCARSAVQLIIEKCDVEDSNHEAVDHMVLSGIDGVILPPPLCDSHVIIDRLAAARIPTVVVATGQPQTTASAIRIDDYKAAEMMTRHLIGIGHKRIGFVRGNPNQTTSQLRYEGFIAALKANGMSVDPELVVQGLFTYHSGLQAADTLLGLEHRPSAIFASNDDMAAAAVAVAHRLGLDVPRDLTVCGFDDTALATSLWPELTTIRQPVADMSQHAVLRLLEAINCKFEDQQFKAVDDVMDFSLILRQSDGPPNSGHHVVKTRRPLDIG